MQHDARSTTTSRTRRATSVLVASAALLAACGGGDDDSATDTVTCEAGQTDGDLALFNWSEYIDPEQIGLFEEEYGVSVTETTYDSNEAMQAIVSQGNSGYDLVIPSDYMVGIMAEAGQLRQLDRGALSNIGNLDPEFVGRDFDPENRYSVPYQVGTTGLTVDTAAVGTDFPRSWSLVFDPAVADEYSGRITLLNDPRETLGAALVYLGYSVNTTDQDELDEAATLIADTRSRLAAFDTDSSEELLVDGETAIAHTYSGDVFAQIIETDDPSQYVYFVPEEGGVRWIDNMAIPFDAPHPCTATTFIDWILRADQGATLTNYTYYDTPNAAARDGLDDDLVAFVEDESVVAGGSESLQLLRDTGDFEINYSDAFVEAKG